MALSQYLKCSLARAAGMTALQSPLATIIQNIYIEKSENYLNNKNYDVTTFVKDQATGELHVKIQILYNQLASFLTILDSLDCSDVTKLRSIQGVAMLC